jgi:hypothetical protein
MEAQAIRALVTDIDLGGSSPTGWDVARRARELHPELPVVYLSLRKKLQSASFFSGLRRLRLLTARHESVCFAGARPCFSRHFGPGPRM